MSEEINRRRFLGLGGAAGGSDTLGGAGYGARWTPEVGSSRMTMGAGMSRILVVYGSGSGCTIGVAQQIGKTLSERGATVEVVAATAAPAPAGYDAVVVGSGVRAGNWHGPVKGWVCDNAAALREVPVAFFTACLTIATDPSKRDEVRAYTDPVIKESGVEPVDIGLFAGWNEPKKFSFIERTILKMMKAPEGDFRDFTAIGAWTAETAPKLGLT